MPATRQRYSFGTFDAARHGISKEERARISRYTRKDISDMLERDLTSGHTYWKALTEVAEVLHHHPDPVVRHECAFVLGEFPYRGDLERCMAIRQLQFVYRFDPNIIVKHESLEALGEFFGIASVGAGADVAKLLAFPQGHHPDVIATARETLDHILGYLKRQGYHNAARTIQRWSRPPK